MCVCVCVCRHIHKMNSRKEFIINNYVALAMEKGRSIENVKGGFDVALPRKLKRGFLKRMNEEGWVPYSETKMKDKFIMINLVPR